MSADGFLHQRSKNYGKIPYEMMTDLTLSHGAVRLYAYMHWRYGSNNKNFESQRSMADAMGVSRRTITKYVAELEQGDWIVVIERSNQRGRESNFYHVFEFQEDCHRWREGHQRPKPEREAVERKPRQGVGGAPSHGRNGNSSSPSYQTGNTNSSSHTPANSSSHTPANSSSQQYPDSRIIQTHEDQEESPNGDSVADPPDGGQPGVEVESSVLEAKFGYTTSQTVYWLYQHKTGRRYTKSVPATILRFTKHKVWIRVIKRDQTIEEKCVYPDKLSIEPHQLPTLTTLTPEQQVIGRWSLQLEDTDGIGPDAKKGINRVIGALRDTFINNDYPLPDELEAIYVRSKAGGLTAPVDPFKVVRMVKEDRKTSRLGRNGSRPDLAPIRKFIHVDGCPDCTDGMVIDQEGKSRQCPRCEETAERKALPEVA
jgi:hypothetical protein